MFKWREKHIETRTAAAIPIHGIMIAFEVIPLSVPIIKVVILIVMSLSINFIVLIPALNKDKGQERDGAYAAVSGWIRNAALPFQVPGAGWCIQWIAADATRQASEEHEVIVMNGEIAVMMDKK